jgi:predicted phage terminase large subunit-like protein
MASSFHCFVQGLNPKWIIPNFHKEIFKHLESGLNLLLSMPPDHSKSTIATVLYACWWLGKNPSKKIVIAVGNPKLVSIFSIEIRKVIESEIYQRVFNLRIRKDSDSKTMFHTINGGQLVIVSKNSGISGIRADLILFDDIVGGAEDARSEVERENSWRFVTRDLLTRGTDQLRVIGIGTRWHEEDILCRLDTHPEFKNYVKVKYKAIDENGKALWPERHDIDYLKSQKVILGTRDFAAMYQQEPLPEEGSIIKKNWLKYVDIKTVNLNVGEQIIVADLAFKGEQDSDYNVFGLFHKAGSMMTLVDLVRKRCEFSVTLTEFKSFCLKHPMAFRRYVEDAANASALYSILSKDMTGIILKKVERDKVARLNLVTPFIEAGNFQINKELQHLDDYIAELLSFPNGKNDDMVDVTTMGLTILATKSAPQFAS